MKKEESKLELFEKLISLMTVLVIMFVGFSIGFGSDLEFIGYSTLLLIVCSVPLILIYATEKIRIKYFMKTKNASLILQATELLLSAGGVGLTVMVLSTVLGGLA